MSALDYKALLKEELAKIKEEKKKTISNDTCITLENNNTSNIVSSELVTKSIAMSIPINWKSYKVGSLSTLYYIPDIISLNDEQNLITLIDITGKSSSPHSTGWVQLKTRKLQCLGKSPPAAQNYKQSTETFGTTEENVSGSDNVDGSKSSGNKLPRVKDIDMPLWLESICSDLVNANIFLPDLRPNNVLINRYDNAEGILHHTDGPSYHDKVAIISLGADCLFTFKPNLKPNEIGLKPAGDQFSVLLKARSLLIFDKDVYNEYMHGIVKDEPGSQMVGSTAPCLNSASIGVADGYKVPQGIRTSITLRRLKN